MTVLQGLLLLSFIALLHRTVLLRLLKTRRQRAPFRGSRSAASGSSPSSARRDSPASVWPIPTETLTGKLAALPPGVTVAADRIEVQFGSAKEAVARLFALAQALTHDYDRFEAIVGGGEVST